MESSFNSNQLSRKRWRSLRRVYVSRVFLVLKATTDCEPLEDELIEKLLDKNYTLRVLFPAIIFNHIVSCGKK